MGTRGLIGTICDGAIHGSYNQYDMYPSGAGRALQNEMRGLMADRDIRIDVIFDELRPMVRRLRYVNASEDVPADELAKYEHIHDRRVSTGFDWYSALRGNQGSLLKQLETGVTTDQPDFLKDSLFCEWAYLFDFDNERVLILKGFNQERDREWEHCRVDVDAWTPSYEGEELKYFGCAKVWEGALPEFLALDMDKLEDDIDSEDEARWAAQA